MGNFFCWKIIFSIYDFANKFFQRLQLYENFSKIEMQSRLLYYITGQ